MKCNYCKALMDPQGSYWESDDGYFYCSERHLEADEKRDIEESSEPTGYEGNKPLFYFGQQVRHVSSETIYDIVDIPVDNERLEHCNEPYYKYRCQRTGVEWARRQSEMEDGRFSPL